MLVAMDSSIAAAAAAAAAAGTRLLVGEGRCRRGIGERLLAATPLAARRSLRVGRCYSRQLMPDRSNQRPRRKQQRSNVDLNYSCCPCASILA